MAFTYLQRTLCRLLTEYRIQPGTALVAVGLALSLSPPAGWAEEDDGLPHAFEAGWKGEAVCEVLSEDETVRIRRCRFAPGVGHDRHYHHTHFGYVLAGGTMRIEGPDGVETVETRAGASWSSDEISVHEVLNVGDTTASYLIVEPKRSAKRGQSLPAQSPVEDWRGPSVEPAAGASEPTGAGREPAAAKHPLSFLVGAWCGAGETSDSPSTQRITWESVLGGQFVKIHLHNLIQTSAGDYDFEGVGYYRPDGEDRLAGTWVDSQGVIHPISARLRGTELDATWGTEDTTQGRSVYRLADGRLEVEDYIHAGTWKRFGESKLERCD